MTPSETGNSPAIILIEHRTLVRECLELCIRDDLGYQVVSFPDIDSWRKASPELNALLIFLSPGEDEEESLRAIGALESSVPVVILSVVADIGHIRKNLEAGARGCLSTDTELDVAMEVVRLVLAGGVYAPADALLGQYPATSDSPSHEQSNFSGRQFSERQEAVLDALRRGKRNKIIAYELGLSESTVKLHVHNIMKKLQAKNRTEAAARASAIGTLSYPR